MRISEPVAVLLALSGISWFVFVVMIVSDNVGVVRVHFPPARAIELSLAIAFTLACAACWHLHITYVLDSQSDTVSVRQRRAFFSRDTTLKFSAVWIGVHPIASATAGGCGRCSEVPLFAVVMHWEDGIVDVLAVGERHRIARIVTSLTDIGHAPCECGPLTVGEPP